MDAKEANKIAKEAKERMSREEYESQYREIFGKIEAAAEYGHYEISANYKLHKDLEMDLRELGYKVINKKNKSTNMDSTVISWLVVEEVEMPVSHKGYVGKLKNRR